MFNCKKVLLNFFVCFTFHKKEIKLFNLQKRRNPGSAAPQCFKTNILILSIPERERRVDGDEVEGIWLDCSVYFSDILPTKKFLVMIKYFNSNCTRKREKGGARVLMRKGFDLTVLPSFWNILSRSQAKTCWNQQILCTPK